MSAAIQPLRIATSDVALYDLKHRLRATRWPDREAVDVPSQPFARGGATPRFVDHHADGLLLDASLLEDSVNERTRCSLPVHLYGRPVQMEPLLELAAKCPTEKVGAYGDGGICVTNDAGLAERGLSVAA